MKALQYNRLGGPQVLQWNEIKTLSPGPRQVLILIKAASLNRADSEIRSGVVKFPGSDQFPRGMGMDFSGIAAKVGELVTHIKAGDKVMGFSGPVGGSFGDCLVAEAENVFLMPVNLSYEQGTALPINASTALKVVKSYLMPSAGKKILIHGATGGIGLFALQFCKFAGAFVTGTVSCQKGLIELIKLGTDEVIDYHKTNIHAIGKTWDAILDTSGKLDFNQAQKLLNENGEFTTMTAQGDSSKPARSQGSRRENLACAVSGLQQLTDCQIMASEGKLKIFVGQRFHMRDAIEAIRQFETGQIHVIGKVVLVNE